MDNTNYTNEANIYENGYDYQQQNGQFKRNLLRVLLALVVAAVVWALIALLSTIIAHRSMGAVQINVSKDVQVEVLSSGNGQPKVLGTGSRKTWLKPGNYQIIAKGGTGGASSVVTVVKRKLATVDLAHLQKTVPHKQLAHYTAQDLYAGPDNKSLYFLSPSENLLYTLTLGSSAAKPYLIDKAYQVGQVGWISPTEFFTDVNSVWTHVNGNISTPMQYNGQNAAPGLASFSGTGAYAYLTAKNEVISAASPQADAQKIGSIETGRDKAGGDEAAVPAVAPDGSVVVYGAGTDGKGEPTKLYQDGQAKSLPNVPNGIIGVQWANDSSKFSYVTDKGLFVYNLEKKSITQVFVQKTDSPTAVFWLNPSTLIYAGKGDIWRYQTDSSTAVSDMAADYAGSLTDFDEPFTLGPDDQTVYYSTRPANGKGGYIYSVVPNYNSLSKDQQQAIQSSQQNAVPQSAPTYSGTDDLLDNMTPDQVTNMEYAFSQYFASSHTAVHNVQISEINPVPINPDSTSDMNTVYFSVSLDDKAYYARLDYDAGLTIRLRLYQSDQKTQLFDSGNVSTASD